MNAAILSLLLLCAVVHHGNCLPQKYAFSYLLLQTRNSDGFALTEYECPKKLNDTIAVCLTIARYTCLEHTVAALREMRNACVRLLHSSLVARFHGLAAPLSRVVLLEKKDDNIPDDWQQLL